MKKFRFLEHTADQKFQAFGKTLEEAFENAAYALKTTITESKIEQKVKKTIEVKSEDKKALLYDFLEQFLILLDSENFILSEIESLKIKDLKLTAKLKGDTDLKKYEINTHIKAVTYQEMKIKKEKNNYMVQVILDL